MGKINKNDRTQNNIDQHFREQLRDINATPPKFMWDNIEQQLENDKQKAKYDHWYYVILAILIPVTIANFLFNYSFDSISEEIFTSTNQRVAAIFTGKKANSNIKPNKSRVINLSEKELYVNNTLPVTEKQHNKQNNRKLNSENNILNNNDFTLTKVKNNKLLFGKNLNQSTKVIDAILPSKKINNTNNETTISLTMKTDEIDTRQLSLLNENVYSSAINTDDIINQTEVILNNLKGFYFGTDVRVANNWFLIKQAATNNFINNDVQYQFKYGISFGGSVGYNFNKNFGIETEILFARQGQSYTDNTFKKVPIQGNIDLTYIRTPLLFKYKWTNISATTEKPIVFNILFGPVFSRLINSEYTVSNEQFAQKAIIPLNELGLVMGFEYDLFLNNNSFLTLGIRTGVSSDIHSFPYVGPNTLKTLNLDLGLNAAYNFQIRSKKKSAVTF